MNLLEVHAELVVNDRRYLLPENSPAAFRVMAKPSGATCNLDCDYSFFLSKEMLYPGSRFWMAEDAGPAGRGHRVGSVWFELGKAPEPTGTDRLETATKSDRAGHPRSEAVQEDDREP